MRAPVSQLTEAQLRSLLAGLLLAAAVAACGGDGSTDGHGGIGGAPAPPSPGGTTATAQKWFVNPTWRTSQARVAVDGAGALHVAVNLDEPDIDQRPTSAAYRYCASGCDSPAAWQEVRLGRLVRSVQLKLTPQGRPRLLIAADSDVYLGGKDYFFAACDNDCTVVGSWSMTRVFSGKVPAWNLDNDDELPQRGFALDPQGRPRLVVYDENTLAEPAHRGLYYLSCEQTCEQATQWRETLISRVAPFAMDRVSQPALALGPDGRPHVTSAQFYPLGDGAPALVYLSCSLDCEQSASWGQVALMPRGNGSEPSADIAVDHLGRPRIAFYQEALLNNQGKRLFYLACDGACMDAAHWQRTELGLGRFNGQEPDLELDAQGRPRVAYADWDRGGLGYAWCNQDCSLLAGGWQHRLLEDRDALYLAWPVAYPAHCTGGLWNTLRPTLALQSGDRAHIAFDTTYHARCLYDHNPYDNVPPGAEMNLITRAGRVVSIN